MDSIQNDSVHITFISTIKRYEMPFKNKLHKVLSFEFFTLITTYIVHNKLRKQMYHHGNEAKRFLGNNLELLELAYSVVTCKENEIST